MATITKRMTGLGEVRYLAQVRLKGCPAQSRTFERKTDAKAWAQQVESDLRLGRNRGLAIRERHTLAELVARYVEDILPDKPAVGSLYKRHLEWWSVELGSDFPFRPLL